VDLFEEPRVIEKSATQRDSIAQHHKRLGENEGSVSRRAIREESCGNIQPGGRIDVRSKAESSTTNDAKPDEITRNMAPAATAPDWEEGAGVRETSGGNGESATAST